LGNVETLKGKNRPPKGGKAANHAGSSEKALGLERKTSSERGQGVVEKNKREGNALTWRENLHGLHLEDSERRGRKGDSVKGQTQRGAGIRPHPRKGGKAQ